MTHFTWCVSRGCDQPRHASARAQHFSSPWKLSSPWPLLFFSSTRGHGPPATSSTTLVCTRHVVYPPQRLPVMLHSMEKMVCFKTPSRSLMSYSALQNSPRNPRRHSGNSFWSSSRTSLSSSSLPLPPFRSSLLCSKTPQMRLSQAHSWSLLLSFLFLWQMRRLVSCKSQAQKKQSTSVLCFFTLISNLINICRLSKNTLQTKQRSFGTARPHVYMPPSSSRVTSSLSLSVTRSLQTLGSSPFLQAASV